VSTPGSGGPQPPENDPSQPGQPTGWGQQPPAGQPFPGQQPPAGQPFPGQQPPAGQPFPGQQPPVGAQPWGAPQPGQPGFGQPAGAQAFGQPQKPKRKWLPIVGGIVALIVVLGALSTFLGGGKPKVGDCLHQKSASEYETVKCDAKNADYKIVGTDSDMTGTEFDKTDANSLCTDQPDATYVLWYGSKNDEKGTVFCASDI
jgi:hypothetical protein